ncbi:MAG: glutamine-hydrolyzing GMP synthase [Legionellaceae bacterium]
MKKFQRQGILILDFGSQYTQLIARRVRELGVYCEIHASLTLFENLKFISGIILSGGPATVTEEHTQRAPEWIFESGLPILGICYGMQAMAVALGGQVDCSMASEFGYAHLMVDSKCSLLEGIEDVWMSHGDSVTALPADFECIASTTNTPIAAMAHKTKAWFGLQFHPEVTHTVNGQTILSRFVIDTSHAPVTWTTTSILEEMVDEVKRKVGQEKVLLALSGGVDSSVVAALLHQAIGHQLVAVFVDTGLLRQDEVEEVKEIFTHHFQIQLIVVDAHDRFLNALKNISCPEEKRKIIGRTFIEVFDEEAENIPGVRWLAQGTIYPDVIESAATTTHGGAALIKSHHNVGGLPETLNLKLLEPLRELFKDEVRAIGLALGLPRSLIYRHPFPGPGLAVRILGAIEQTSIDILRRADALFIQALRDEGLYESVSQAFAVFLPVKSVGVTGDGRRYEPVICLRAVHTEDFMTATWAHLPWDFLSRVSHQIINEVPGISRVTYDISGKPPASIEWE